MNKKFEILISNPPSLIPGEMSSKSEGSSSRQPVWMSMKLKDWSSCTPSVKSEKLNKSSEKNEESICFL